jgi:hypothetical protein
MNNSMLVSYWNKTARTLPRIIDAVIESPICFNFYCSDTNDELA